MSYSFICRCETCGKGFLRRERYVTHVRIHTGEKPFVCAVCSRGYRDKRELKKHQIAHNHSGQSAPIPGNQPASSSLQQQQNSTVVVAAPSSGLSQNNIQQEKTIVIQQTVSLPNQPIPKELLTGNAPQPAVPTAPLNPATIPLPPSVASALQSINEKVAAKQAKVKQINQSASSQVITLAKHQQQQQQEQTQVLAIPSGATLSSSSTSSQGSGNSSGPLFYYVMPGNVPHNIVSEGGATVRVTTGEGSGATAQLISVPASAIQSVQTSSGNSTSFPNWILESPTTASTATSNRSGSM